MPRAKKSSGSARDFLAWAGFFVQPKDDGDVFATLPGWRQREALYLREQWAKGRSPSLDELTRLKEGEPLGPVEVTIPSTIPLRSLRNRGRGPAPDAVTLEDLRPVVTRDDLLAHCTGNGEGKRLRTDPPTHGLYAYVWARAMLRRRAIDSLPLTFFWELEEGIEQLTGKITSTRVPEAAPVLSWLDAQAQTLVSLVA